MHPRTETPLPGARAQLVEKCIRPQLNWDGVISDRFGDSTWRTRLRHGNDLETPPI
jgi:hypothetical protein